MVDQIFSFAELGFQETETSRYLVDLLRKNGFTVREGYAGIPTAWVATWGSGKPVIALGSDIDGIPQASQLPGVACRAPLVPGAPEELIGTKAYFVRAGLFRDVDANLFSHVSGKFGVAWGQPDGTGLISV